MVVLGQIWLYSCNLHLFGQSVSIWAKLVVCGQINCFGAKLVVFEQIACLRAKYLYLGKLIFFGQCSCIWESCSIRAKW